MSARSCEKRRLIIANGLRQTKEIPTLHYVTAARPAA
jgi:hypothetical protein